MIANMAGLLSQRVSRRANRRRRRRSTGSGPRCRSLVSRRFSFRAMWIRPSTTDLDHPVGQDDLSLVPAFLGGLEYPISHFRHPYRGGVGKSHLLEGPRRFFRPLERRNLRGTHRHNSLRRGCDGVTSAKTWEFRRKCETACVLGPLFAFRR